MNATDRLTNALLALLVFFGSIHFLDQAQTVVVPLLVALLLSFLSYPLVDWLTKYKVPTVIAITLVVIIAIGFLGGLGLLVRESVTQFVDSYGKYEPSVQAKWNALIANLGTHGDTIKDINLGKQMEEFAKNLAGPVLGTLGNVMVQLALILVYLVFLLLRHHAVPQKIHSAFSPERGKELNSVLDEIQIQVLRYIGLKTVLSLLVGALVWFVLAMFDVDFAPLWGILAFALNYIPTVGSIVSTVPPILLAFIQYDGFTAVKVAAFLIAIQSVIGNFVEPKVMGKGLDLDPLIVLVGLVFFGWLWDIVGAILSVPLMVVVKNSCAHIEGLKPVAVLMGVGTLPTRAEQGNTPKQA
jgi:predicted PurR-regulated permease PerM